MTKLGLMCFANNSGLGNQTRRLAYMLKPSRLLVINSESFSKNTSQHLDWYEGFNGYTVDGFPTTKEVKTFLQGLTHVIVCENPLNYSLFGLARHMGIKTYCQSNYEFADNLNQPILPLPDMFLMPSFWKIEEMKQRFSTPVIHLPPPIDPSEFASAREVNFKRSGSPMHFLHIVGTLAASDRNGTLDLLAALRHTTEQFQLTIKSQHQLPPEYMSTDPRVRYVIENEPNTNTLYSGYDILILPRRYGGLALTCNEALMSGMPVLMTDISPNNQLLSKEWVFPAYKKGTIQTRDLIDVFASRPHDIAKKIDWCLYQNMDAMKSQAFELGYNSFSPTVLLPKYNDLWSQQ